MTKDTGLKTIGFVPPMFVEGKGADYNDIFRSVSIAENYTAVVTRSQAEKLLAEKDQLIQSLNIVVDNFKSRTNTLKADNAAKEARIKYLEDAIKAKGGNEHSPTQDAYDLACKAIEKHRNRAEALEAKLAAAEKALESAEKDFDVLFCTPRVTETRSTEDQFDLVIARAGRFGTDVRKARAALEGRLK